MSNRKSKWQKRRGSASRATNKWWRGQRWNHCGINQAHRRKLMIQCIGATQPRVGPYIGYTLEKLYAKCTMVSAPDLILVSHQTAVEFGLFTEF